MDESLIDVATKELREQIRYISDVFAINSQERTKYGDFNTSYSVSVHVLTLPEYL